MANTPSKLDRLKEKQRQLAAQIAQLDAREKAEDRKKDTRRKIVAGGVFLANIRRGESKDRLIALLDKGLTNDRDRALFDFLPDKGSAPKNPETNNGDDTKSD